MSRIRQYHLHGLFLTVNDSAYLVEIGIDKRKQQRNAAKVRISDLPDWIFRSRHAIWLTVERLSIQDRAKHGDHIRKKLMQARQSGSETDLVRRAE
jgi:hypothetical protein